MLAANLLTNDVNKESREFDTTVSPGWDEHLGYGIIDLDKALKSIDAFETGYLQILMTCLIMTVFSSKLDQKMVTKAHLQ